MDKIYTIIEGLCRARGVSINEMCKACGLTAGTLTDFKMGRTKRLSTPTLQKIAGYFGTTVDYLLSGGQPGEPPAGADAPLTMDDFTYAMHNESQALTEAQKEALLNMARLFRQQQEGPK